MKEQINLEKHTQEVYSWLDEISQKTGAGEKNFLAYKMLRGVLHAIRDRMILEEVFHLSAQLPLFVRGLFFEGYKPKDKPEKMNANEFLERIRENLGRGNLIEPDVAFGVILEVLYKQVSKGELTDIRGSWPKDLQKLWDQKMPAEVELKDS